MLNVELGMRGGYHHDSRPSCYYNHKLKTKFKILIQMRTN